MKYIHSRKFKAFGIAVATAVAVASATPGAATPYHHVTDTTGGMTDTTGGMTDNTGHNGYGGKGDKGGKGGKGHKPQNVQNGYQNAAIKALILQYKEAYQQGKTDQLLPIAKQLLALGVQIKLPNGGSHSSLGSPKPEPKITDTTGSHSSLESPKPEPKPTDTSGSHSSLESPKPEHPNQQPKFGVAYYKHPAKVHTAKTLVNQLKSAHDRGDRAKYNSLLPKAKHAMDQLKRSENVGPSGSGW
jgi:hypothetical protein